MQSIDRLPRDEMASHLAEIVEDQDNRILSLIQERRALALLLAASVSFSLLF